MEGVKKMALLVAMVMLMASLVPSTIGSDAMKNGMVQHIQLYSDGSNQVEVVENWKNTNPRKMMKFGLQQEACASLYCAWTGCPDPCNCVAVKCVFWG